MLYEALHFLLNFRNPESICCTFYDAERKIMMDKMFGKILTAGLPNYNNWTHPEVSWEFFNPRLARKFIFFIFPLCFSNNFVLGCAEFAEAFRINRLGMEHYLSMQTEYTDPEQTLPLPNMKAVKELTEKSGCCGLTINGTLACYYDDPGTNILLPKSQLKGLAEAKAQYSGSLPELGPGAPMYTPNFCRGCWLAEHTVNSYGLTRALGLGAWMAIALIGKSKQSAEKIRCNCAKKWTKKKKPVRGPALLRARTILIATGKGDHKDLNLLFVKSQVLLHGALSTFQHIKWTPLPLLTSAG